MQAITLGANKPGQDVRHYRDQQMDVSPTCRGQVYVECENEGTTIGFFRRLGTLKSYSKILVIIISGMFFLTSGCQKPVETVSKAHSSSVEMGLYADLGSYDPVRFNATPFSSLSQHSYCEEGGDFDPDITQDGKWIVFSSLRHAPNPDLYIKQVNGRTATRLTSDPASEIQPCFSPGGDKVAFTSNRSGSWDIWVVGVDGSNPTRLTSGISNDIHPSWSPDSKQLVYCSYGPRSSQWELWLVDVTNPGTKKMVGYGLYPEWSPSKTSNKIAFQLPRYRGSQWFSIWTVDIVNGEAKYPTEIISNVSYACISPTWAPDGKSIAYCTVGKDVYEKTDPTATKVSGEDIWMIGLDGRNNHRLTASDASDYSPTWSSDGRVYFCSDRQYIDNIWSAKPQGIDYETETPVELSQHPQSGIVAN
ncbi:MAG: hypothetical protein K9M57_05145 [Phycisphaerae bacterium]|nr:hypothetical protein [Phycisphaerae bacterium]